MLPRRAAPYARWLAVGLLVVLAALAGKVAGPESSRRPGGEGGPAEGPARLVDGDSLFVGGREVRLKGIDAPEGRQSCTRGGRNWPCGEEARRELARLIAGQNVSCNSVESDQHGRLLAICTAGGRELNREMVRSGYAVSYGGFEIEEREARKAGRGLWSGEFQRPRDWRREHGVGG
jgi:endonuclease YncB( thermonuclease family)